MQRPSRITLDICRRYMCRPLPGPIPRDSIAQSPRRCACTRTGPPRLVLAGRERTWASETSEQYQAPTGSTLSPPRTPSSAGSCNRHRVRLSDMGCTSGDGARCRAAAGQGGGATRCHARCDTRAAARLPCTGGYQLEVLRALEVVAALQGHGIVVAHKGLEVTEVLELNTPARE